MTARPRSPFGIALVAVLAQGLIAPDARALAGDERAVRLEFLPNGLLVGDSAPRGWTNLVLKSRPKLQSGDLSSLPNFAKKTASLYRTVIALEVRPSGTSGVGYELRRIGIGLCLPSRQGDRIVRSKVEDDLVSSLGMIERKVLDKAEEELAKTRLTARTPSLAILHAPSTRLVGDAHVPVLLTYAFLLDQKTGYVATVVWSAALGSSRSGVIDRLNILPPDLIYECGLDVKASYLLSALPVDWSFAMRELPPGRSIDADRSLAEWTRSPERIVRDPAGFERVLRQRLTLSAQAERPIKR